MARADLTGGQDQDGAWCARPFAPRHGRNRCGRPARPPSQTRARRLKARPPSPARHRNSRSPSARLDATSPARTWRADHPGIRKAGLKLARVTGRASAVVTGRTSSRLRAEAYAKRWRCIKQPVAQTLAQARAPQDLGFLLGNCTRYGGRVHARVVCATGGFMRPRPIGRPAKAQAAGTAAKAGDQPDAQGPASIWTSAGRRRGLSVLLRMGIICTPPRRRIG
jgi:hypothetical protein